MNTIKELIFFVVATLFLGFNWLWNRLDALVWRVGSFIPVKTIKGSLIDLMNYLPPYAALLLFIIPYVFILPIKLCAFWLISEDHWFLGMGTLLMVKLLGLGLIAFLFDIGRGKFLSIGWFKWMYHHIIAFRHWCHTIIDPYKKKVHTIWVFLSEKFYKSALWQKMKFYYTHWKDRIK